MTLKDLGYQKVGSLYIKVIGKYKIEVAKGADSYIRRVKTEDSTLGVEKFKSLQELESDDMYKEIVRKSQTAVHKVERSHRKPKTPDRELKVIQDTSDREIRRDK